MLILSRIGYCKEDPARVKSRTGDDIVLKIFDKISNADIVLEKNADKAVILAAEDLKKNLLDISVSNKNFKILFAAEITGNIAVKTENDPEKPEGYTVKINEDGAVITGTDTLGTVFGIYAFAEKILKIDPMYRLTDLFPESREELTVKNAEFFSPERKVRFRGWFLNDEDLLTDFKISGGRRNIDYPFYGNVMDVTVLDMIIETALRCEINLMIPSSFIDIGNPDEAVLIEQVVKRGMYVSQHHIEPVGVSHFTADNYLKARNLGNETVSFITNRDRMVEMWSHYIKLWAKYGDRVIWQLGLRGKGDQAVWKSDPRVPDDMAGRGAIISDAINTQYDIICKTLGHRNFYSTSTLWLEGAALYGKGYLKLPEKTVVIFSDIGNSQMFGDDFYTTKRKSDSLYGIYYHVGFWGHGPHLTEGCDPHKMAFCYREANRLNSLFYSILNVSNVRPLHFSVLLNSKLLREPTADENELIKEILFETYGQSAEEIAPFYGKYYSSIADFGADDLKRRCKEADFNYHEYGPLPFPIYPATDGTLRNKGLNLFNGRYYAVDKEYFTCELNRSLHSYEALYEELEKASEKLSGSVKTYLEQYIKFETFLMMQFTRWLLACVDLMNTCDRSVCKASYETATAALSSVLDHRKILEQGKWQNWHRGETKINVIEMLSLTREAYLKRSGEFENG